MKKRPVLFTCLSLAAAAALYLLLWPVRVEPEAWEPGEPPAPAGVFAPNERLSAARLLPAGGRAPEGVAVDGEGNVYTGLEDGRVVRLPRGGGAPELFAETGGRPLGLQFDGAGDLVVADAARGLLLVGRDGSQRVLSRAAEGRPFGCVNDLDIAADGTVYFTDATDRFPISAYREDLLEHGASGRLLAYDPATGQTRSVLGRLHFANGVALGPDDAFVLVAETGEYRLRREWLKGPRAGAAEVLIDNLPGFPDNVTFNGRGTFWVALVAPRSRLLDALLPRPFVRKVLARLPSSVLPGPGRYGFVVGLDADGRVTETLQDPSGARYPLVSSALEHDGALYLGSLEGDAVGRVPLK